MLPLDIFNSVLDIWLKPTFILVFILLFTRWTPSRSPHSCSWNLISLTFITLFCIPMQMILPGISVASVPSLLLNDLDLFFNRPDLFGLPTKQLVLYSGLILYVFVFLALLQKYLTSYVASFTVVKNARPTTDKKILTAYHSIDVCLPPSPPQFKESHLVSSPVVWGHIRHTIVLPTDWRVWPKDRLKRVLTHEVTHINRKDWVTRQTIFITRALFWFLPPLWVLSERALNYAEYACDDAVVRNVDCRADYANDLLQLSHRQYTSSRYSPFVSAVPSYTEPSELANRIAILLNGARDRSESSTTYKSAVLATALMFILPFNILHFSEAPPLSPRTILYTLDIIVEDSPEPFEETKRHSKTRLDSENFVRSGENEIQLMNTIELLEQNTPSPHTTEKNQLLHKNTIAPRYHFVKEELHHAVHNKKSL